MGWKLKKPGHVSTACDLGPTGAFTLVELLIVILIVGILLGFLVPYLASTERRAMETTCLAKLQQLGRALTAYESQNGILPQTEYGTPGEDPEFFTMQSWLQGKRFDLSTTPHGGQLWSYYKEAKILLCDMDGDGNGVFSYSMPAVLGGVSTTPIRSPSDALLLVEENPQKNLVSKAEGSFCSSDEPGTRHEGKAGTLYADGHGRLYDWKVYKPELGRVPAAEEIEIAPYGANVFPRKNPNL